MSEFEQLLQKVQLENLRSYIVYGINQPGDTFENYEEKIRKSFCEFYGKLESMYEKADRNDNQLNEAVLDFVMIHEDVYFEAGVLTGVRLLQNLEREYDRHKGSDMDFIWKKAGNDRLLKEDKKADGKPMCSEVKEQGEAETP